MCAPTKPTIGNGAPTISPMATGGRLDKAIRDASAANGGGSAPRAGVGSILLGTPRNSDQMAVRKNTLLEV